MRRRDAHSATRCITTTIRVRYITITPPHACNSIRNLFFYSLKSPYCHRHGVFFLEDACVRRGAIALRDPSIDTHVDVDIQGYRYTGPAYLSVPVSMAIATPPTRWQRRQHPKRQRTVVQQRCGTRRLGNIPNGRTDVRASFHPTEGGGRGCVHSAELSMRTDDRSPSA